MGQGRGPLRLRPLWPGAVVPVRGEGRPSSVASAPFYLQVLAGLRMGLVVEPVVIYSDGGRAAPIALPRQARRPAASACRRRGRPRCDGPFCAELAAQVRQPVRCVTRILQGRLFLPQMRRRQCADAADSTNSSILLVIPSRRYLHNRVYSLNFVTMPIDTLNDFIEKARKRHGPPRGKKCSGTSRQKLGLVWLSREIIAGLCWQAVHWPYERGCKVRDWAVAEPANMAS